MSVRKCGVCSFKMDKIKKCLIMRVTFLHILYHIQTSDQPGSGIFPAVMTKLSQDTLSISCHLIYRQLLFSPQNHRQYYSQSEIGGMTGCWHTAHDFYCSEVNRAHLGGLIQVNNFKKVYDNNGLRTMTNSCIRLCKAMCHWKALVYSLVALQRQIQVNKS